VDVPVNQTDCVDLLQIIIHKNYGNRMMSDGVIRLMPNPSNRLTGRTDIIAKLKRHFSNTNDSAQKRKFFLLHGMGGIGKTQICLKFIEEMSNW
jgi:Holliday junction resolvasome RuvABC ATP-dependent DNA helicase subunit